MFQHDEDRIILVNLNWYFVVASGNKISIEQIDTIRFSLKNLGGEE